MMAKNDKGLAVIPASDYRIMKMDQEALPGMLRDNCGDGGLGQFDLDRVPMPTGGALQWAVPNLEGGEDMQASIEGVVVLFQDGRAMWHESYDDSVGGSPPNCQSYDKITGIGDPGGECGTCPLNVFGSGKDKSKKCKEMRVLFVIRPEGILPLVISLPPTSLKNASKYFMRLVMAEVPYYQAITRISLETDKSAGGKKYSKAKFAIVQRLEGDEADNFKKLNTVFKEIFRNVPMVPAVANNLNAE